jgi:hypothetical protein
MTPNIGLISSVLIIVSSGYLAGTEPGSTLKKAVKKFFNMKYLEFSGGFSATMGSVAAAL